MKSLKLLYLVPSLLLLTPPTRAEVVERIVAKVNGEMITLSDFQARQVAALRQAHVPPERQETYLRENSRRLLDEAIDDLLISQKAEEVGKAVPDEYLKQVIEGIKKDYNLKSDQEFEEQIRQEGFTLDEVKKNISRSLLTRRYLNDEIDKKATVTEAEVRAEYEAKKASDYTAPATEQLQEILVSTKEPNAEALAKSLVARARQGEDFAALARANSVAPSRESGGDLGRVARRDMNPTVVEIVSHLAPGQVSDPFPTKSGLRILKLVSRQEGKLTPFDEVKEALRERLQEARRADAMDKLAKRLREHAIIQDMVREVPLAAVQNEESQAGRPSILDAVEGSTVEPEPGTQPAGASDEEFVTKRGAVKKVVPPAADAPSGDKGATPPEAPARRE